MDVKRLAGSCAARGTSHLGLVAKAIGKSVVLNSAAVYKCFPEFNVAQLKSLATHVGIDMLLWVSLFGMFKACVQLFLRFLRCCCDGDPWRAFLLGGGRW